MEEAIINLFCLADDAYASINLKGQHCTSFNRLAHSEFLTLAFFQPLRGLERERSFSRDSPEADPSS